MTKEEYSQVKKLLMVKMKMNDRQADYLLKQKYANSPLKESLFMLEDKPINIEKFNILTLNVSIGHQIYSLNIEVLRPILKILFHIWSNFFIF